MAGAQSCQLRFPRSDLSAFEALELIAPKVKEWDPEARNDLISSSGDLKRRENNGPFNSEYGRTNFHGGWTFRFVSERHKVVVFVSLMASGGVNATSHEMNINTLVLHRPESCIDSTQLTAITESINERTRREGTSPLFDRILRLMTWGNTEQRVWSVHYFCLAKGMPRWDLDLVIDAITGGVIQGPETGSG